MKLTVTDNHDGEGKFPLFKEGTVVENLALVRNELQ